MPELAKFRKKRVEPGIPIQVGRGLREQAGALLTGAVGGTLDAPVFAARQGLRTVENVGRGFVGAEPATSPIGFRDVSNVVGTALLPSPTAFTPALTAPGATSAAAPAAVSGPPQGPAVAGAFQPIATAAVPEVQPSVSFRGPEGARGDISLSPDQTGGTFREPVSSGIRVFQGEGDPNRGISGEEASAAFGGRPQRRRPTAPVSINQQRADTAQFIAETGRAAAEADIGFRAVAAESGAIRDISAAEKTTAEAGQIAANAASLRAYRAAQAGEAIARTTAVGAKAKAPVVKSIKVDSGRLDRLGAPIQETRLTIAVPGQAPQVVRPRDLFTPEQAQTELTRLYNSLSEDKKTALDELLAGRTDLDVYSSLDAVYDAGALDDQN